jgi:hypothetical protein
VILFVHAMPEQARRDIQWLRVFYQEDMLAPANDVQPDCVNGDVVCEPVSGPRDSEE